MFTLSITKRGLYFLLAGMIFICIAATLCFSLWYLVHSHEWLAGWYVGINPCFYRKDFWHSEVFTDQVKVAGNRFCIAAISIALAGIVSCRLLFKRAGKPDGRIEVHISSANFGYFILLTLSCFLLWLWGTLHTLPAYDEVFSAVNCSGGNFFQCWSYYMLPNNHIGFNLLNGVLFHFFQDKVASGRIISLFAYLITAIVVFQFIAAWMRPLFLAFLATVLVMMVFPLWAFSFQARGYECYYFMSVLSFTSLFYYIHDRQPIRLAMFVLSCITGLILIPTFLYQYMSEVIFAVLWIPRRTGLRKFLLAQIMVFSFVYIFYLPAFCFSGTDLIFFNKYVTPFGDFRRILTFCIPYIQEYATYTFSSLGSEYNYANDALFLTPLLLLFFPRNKQHRLIVMYYITQWLVLFVFAVYMRRFPFMRNTGGLVTLSILFTLYTFYALAEKIGSHIPFRRFTTVVMILILYSLGNHFWYTNTDFFRERIYNYPTNERHDNITHNLHLFPKGARIALSDESFYWYYVFRQNHISVKQCFTGDEDYLIKQGDEPFPKGINKDNFECISRFDVYEVYRRIR